MVTSNVVERGFQSTLVQTKDYNLNTCYYGGVMVTSNVVERGFQSTLAQTKDYKIGICCLSANTQH
jgi:hypothetical protein